MAAADYTPIAINAKIETEEVLGSLPDNWEKTTIKVQGRTRAYFVDNKSKKTSWIDPRTAMLRKHNINDVVAGELPYGWEELYDEEFGVFYTDHTTQTNYADPPWTDEVKERVLALKSKLGHELKRMDTNTKFKQDSDQQRIKSGEKAIAELQAQKKRLDEASRKPSSVNVDKRDHEIERKISELRHLNDKLDSENKNLIGEVQSTSMELNEIRQMIEAERAQRSALESYVLQLKQELLQLSPEQARAAREYDDNAAAEAAAEEAALPSIDDESEIANLRARLELEQQERQNLREITEHLLREKEGGSSGSYNAPGWVKDIDVHARAKVLRQKIVNGGINPDSLDFKEKLNKFAVASKNERGPKMPSQAHNPQSEHAVRARETAFGKVDVDESDNEIAREFDEY
ncbi:hypothetical protein HDU67_009180 [Dinochytrium kinnereticum]|nr:hypothetical protein HDU67_009180 [Dinochytrium kinnereticum]